MNSERPRASVNFGPRNILLLNGRILETADYSTHAMGEMIDYLEPHICERIEYLERIDDGYYQPTRLLRPIVLVARMAITHNARGVLTPGAIESGIHFFTDSNHLTPEAFGYWNAVREHTDFTPQVHVLDSKNPQTSGTWLGVSNK